MKKTFRKLGMATALVLAMVGFAACGDDDDDDKGKEEVIDAGSIEGCYREYKIIEDGETFTTENDPEYERDNVKIIKKSDNEFLLYGACGDGSYSDCIGSLKFDGKLLTNHKYLIDEETYMKITGEDTFEFIEEVEGSYIQFYKKISK